MSQARTHPPSDQRVHEARRAGHVPRTSVVGLTAALVGLLLGTWAWGGAFWRELEAFTLGVVAQGGHAAGAALWEQLGWLGARLLALLACSWGAMLLGLLVAQGSARFVPFARPSKLRVDRARPSRTARALAVLVTLIAAGSTLHVVLRVTESSLSDVTSSWLIRLAAFLTACAVVDAALARVGFFRSLWMTRREHLDELREAYGSPELRSARERVRREAARVDARGATREPKLEGP